MCEWSRRLLRRLVGMRTALVNQIRGFLLECGLAVGRGRRTLEKALPGLLEDHATALGAGLCWLIERLRAQWRALDEPIRELDEQIMALARRDEASQRLMGIPGVGRPDAGHGLGGRDRRHGRRVPQRAKLGRVAGLGPTAAQHRRGGKTKLLGVARHGNRYLRRLLVHAARAFKRVAIGRDDRLGRWLQGLDARAHANVATVALAAKLARFAPPRSPDRGPFGNGSIACRDRWAIMARNESYRAPA